MPRLPESARSSLCQRLNAHALARWPALAEVEVRFRGNFAYIGGRTVADVTLPLCRLHYEGSASSWGFAVYRAKSEDYESTALPGGSTAGTPEEGLDRACAIHLGDPARLPALPLAHGPADLPGDSGRASSIGGTPTVFFGHDSRSAQLRSRSRDPASDADACRDRFFARLDRDIGLQAFDVLDDIFLFAKDADRRFVYYNTAFQRLMGLAFPDELIGLRDEDISPQYLVERYRHADELVLQGARLDDIIELVRNSPTGYDWFITSKFPATDRDGRVIGLVGLTRKLSSREGDPVAASISDLAPAVDLMLLEYHRNLSIRELAAAACLSTSEFSRVFKRRFHVTPHQYLLQIRLELACELLATSDYSVGHIAKLTGFYDQSHMTNALVNARGVSPREYRKEFRISRPPDTPVPVDPQSPATSIMSSPVLVAQASVRRQHG